MWQAYQNGADEGDQEQFLRALQSSLEIFVNRMKSNSQRGRSIANDSSVQSLFNVISNMHPQLMKYTQEQEDMRGTCIIHFKTTSLAWILYIDNFLFIILNFGRMYTNGTLCGSDTFDYYEQFELMLI